MNSLVKITVDNERCHFILTGEVGSILNNRRLLVSLRRLRYEVNGNQISIPFENRTQVKTLRELEDILKNFGYSEELSGELENDMKSYVREQRNFQTFSEKARDIRNNSFDIRPELVEDFKDFKKVLEEQLTGRKLYPLQLLSSYHMAFSQNSCNFSVPGAGKTSIVYAAYTYLKNKPNDDPRHVDKLLIIGPLSSFAPWENEYEECFGSKADSMRLSGDEAVLRVHKERHLYSANPSEITLIFYGGVDSLRREIMDFLKANKTMVVVDEAHRIKNADGVWGKSIVDIAREAKARVVLTGTPVPNGYEDLYNLFQFLYPYKFKDILGFHYGNLVDMTRIGDTESDRVKSFTKNISPYFIRIKKRDLKLPPVREQVINVPMGDMQREIYDFIETKYIRSFERNASATVKDFLNKAKLVRLRQAASNPSLLRKSIEETLDREDFESTFGGDKSIPEEYQDDSEILLKIRDYAKSETPRKFQRILELLTDEIVPDNQKVIIWTVFIQNAKELREYFQNNGIVSKLLIGEVKQEEREMVVKKFNDPENKEFRVVIANPFAVAESISLHKGCHNAIYMERDYNCSNFLQSKDRIHRVGLEPNQVTRYFYVLSGDSIDGVINERLEWKVRRMEKIIDEEIPLFLRLNDSDETDLVKSLIEDYARRA